VSDLFQFCHPDLLDCTTERAPSFALASIASARAFRRDLFADMLKRRRHVPDRTLIQTEKTQRLVGPVISSQNPSGVASRQKPRKNGAMSATKSRQSIWRGRIKLANSQAEHARKRAGRTAECS
jgi:hypothetical protein